MEQLTNLWLQMQLPILSSLLVLSIIHSGHFYSASSSPLLIRSAPDIHRRRLGTKFGEDRQNFSGKNVHFYATNFWWPFL